jgi:hypothetical protein
MLHFNVSSVEHRLKIQPIISIHLQVHIILALRPFLFGYLHLGHHNVSLHSQPCAYSCSGIRILVVTMSACVANPHPVFVCAFVAQISVCMGQKGKCTV